MDGVANMDWASDGRYGQGWKSQTMGGRYNMFFEMGREGRIYCLETLGQTKLDFQLA